ncbi:cytochrome b [Nocardia sp. NPDC051570]|uniref:cytochrome b n=1 Tax=Nocardia sp. NPDC051570 TaxID=3364324 RepID=UPI0037A68AE8
MNVAAEPVAGTERVRFDPLTRIIHWLMVIGIVAMLVLGVMLWRQIGDYSWVQVAHQSIGIGVLVVAVIRIGNRVLRRAPRSTLGRGERVLAAGGELAMYLLLLAQPIVGWAMSSATGAPVTLAYGLTLPSIAPADPHLFGELRTLHIVLAWALVAVVSAHIGAVGFHTLVLRDGVASRMLLGPTRGRSGRGRRYSP